MLAPSDLKRASIFNKNVGRGSLSLYSVWKNQKNYFSEFLAPKFVRPYSAEHWTLLHPVRVCSTAHRWTSAPSTIRYTNGCTSFITFDVAESFLLNRKEFAMLWDCGTSWCNVAEHSACQVTWLQVSSFDLHRRAHHRPTAITLWRHYLPLLPRKPHYTVTLHRTDEYKFSRCGGFRAGVAEK